MTVILVFSTISASAAIPLAAIAHADQYYQFQSPSGNIGCGMALLNNNGFALCEIGDHTWVAPSRPPDCPRGWGDRIGINQGGAPALSCHTDTMRGSVEPTLNYGDKWSVNSITCDSELSGIHAQTPAPVTSSALRAIPMGCTDEDGGVVPIRRTASEARWRTFVRPS